MVRWVLVLVVPVLFMGCREAGGLPQRISAFSLEFQKVGKEFGAALAKAKDAGAREKAHAAAVRELDALLQQTREVPVPGDARSQELWGVFQEYLKVEERIIRVDAKELVKDPSLGNDRGRRDEEKALEALKAALEKYSGR